MSIVRRILAAVILLAVLIPVPVCPAQCPCECSCEPARCSKLGAWWQRLKDRFRGKKCDECDLARIPPASLRPAAATQQGGMLLKTGSFQLGPGVNQDLLSSQGDGKAGFFNVN